MTHPTQVTFVGLGAIGLPMAALLTQAGHSVTGVDPFEGPRAKAQTVGMRVADRIDHADPADIVIVMVATPTQLDELVTQAGSTVAGQLWVIMSTVGPEAVSRASQRLTAAGALTVDAPVTGGVARALTGDLVIFASGVDADVDAAHEVLSVLGAVRRVGSSVGQGQAIKVINQHLCAVHIVAAAEALNLASSLGLDPSTVLELVEGGAGGSWMLSDRGPRMLLGNDAPVTSTIGIFVKDSGLVADAAATSGAVVPLLDEARRRYLAAHEQGLGARDDSRVIETYSVQA